MNLDDDWDSQIYNFKKSYSYAFDPAKDWIPLLDLATQLAETYDNIKKDTGYTYSEVFDWSVQKWLVGLQGEFLYQYMFDDVNSFDEFNFEIYKKTGDGGIDAKLFGKTVEIKTSEWTRMPKDYEYCLCGDFNNGDRHHLIAFPDYFAQGKYRLGTYKEIVMLFKTKNLDISGSSFDLPQRKWIGPYYQVEFCGFRTTRSLMKEIDKGKEYTYLKSGKNYAWCEKQLANDFNALRDWIRGYN